MYLLLGTVFVASVLGSLHCVGMCGPFALLAGASKEKKAAWAPTAAYSLGRLVTYAIIGFVFGALGMALNAGTAFATWQQSATYVAGTLMILVGCIALLRHWGVRVALPKVFQPIQGLLQKGFSRTKRMKPVARALTIGALTSLMPCGWLYTFAITAAGTGSPWYGMLLMSVFWAGTVPIMTALVFGFNRIGRSFQKRVPVLMASLVIVVGVFTIGYRAPVTLGQQPEVVSGDQNLIQQIREVDHEKLPCCGGDKK